MNRLKQNWVASAQPLVLTFRKGQFFLVHGHSTVENNNYAPSLPLGRSQLEHFLHYGCPPEQ